MMELSSQIEKIPDRSNEKKIEAKEELLKRESKTLSNYGEPSSFYRGLDIKDAFLSLFGKLKLESDPGDIVGQRDNATINSVDAVAHGRASLTKDGKKFICAIGFDPMPGSSVESSKLGRWNQFRISGFVIAREIIVRFAGNKPGKPGKVKVFSPKSFYSWYIENVI